MTTTLRVLALILTVTSTTLTCGTASARDVVSARVEAKKHFQRAVALYEEQDYKAALAEFQRAYDIAPNFKILYDIAQTQYQLQAYPKAIDTFEQYLKSGDREISRSRRTDVEEALARLRTRIASLTISVNVATADVMVDDEVVGSQVASVSTRVNAGQHRVSAVAKGYVTATKSVNVVGEDKAALRLDLEPEPEVVPALPATAAGRTADEGPRVADANRARDDRRSRTPFFVGLGTTSVLAAGAIGFGVASIVGKGTYDTALRSTADSPDRIDGARRSVQTTSLVADVLTVAAVVSGATTVVLFLASRGRATTSTKSAAACATGLCGTF